MHRVLLTCPYYLAPGETKRDVIPAGVTVEIVGTSANSEWSQISGQDPNPWRGKWVRSFYLELVVEDTEPEPPPEPEPDPGRTHRRAHTVRACARRLAAVLAPTRKRVL
jgi:hypothetical protein